MTRNMLTIKEQDEFLLIIFNRLLMGFKWFNGSQFIKPNTLSWQFLIILQFGKFGSLFVWSHLYIFVWFPYAPFVYLSQRSPNTCKNKFWGNASFINKSW